MERDSRRLISLLLEDGWTEAGITGSHHHLNILPSRAKLQTAPEERPSNGYCSVDTQAGGTFEINRIGHAIYCFCS